MGVAKDFIVNILGDSSGAEKAFDAFGKHASKIAAGAAAAFLGAKIGESISSQLDVASATAHMQAQLGTMPAETARMGAVAGQVWAKGFTGEMPEVNEGLAAVRRNIGDLGELGAAQMTNLTTKAIAASDVFGQDLTRTTAAVGKILKNDLAPNADAAFDLITTGLQSNANEADDLLDTYIEYSTQFRQLGLDGKTALGIINQGMEAGARNADVVADALKEFAIRGQGAVTRGAKEQAAAMESAKQAGQSLSRAQEGEMRAQKALTNARKDAEDQLRSMSEAIVGAELSERGAVISKKRAAEELDRVMKDSESSQLDKDEAQLAYDQAVHSLDEQRQSVVELRAERDQADKAGVNGSANVVAAEEAVVEAKRAVAEAVKANSAAQTEASNNLTALGLAYQSIGVDGVAAQQAIAAGGPQAKQALSDVLDGLRGVENPAERSALAVTLFGTKAEDLAEALYALDPETAAKGMDTLSGSSDRMVDSLGEDPKNRVEEMRRAMSNWASGLVNIQGPVGDAIVLFAAIGPGAIQVLAALGPLALFMGGPMVGSLAAAGSAIAGFGAAMMASPVTWIVLGIIAGLLILAGISYLIMTNWEGITKWFGELWANICIGVETFVGWIGDYFLNWTPLGIIIKNWDGISKWFGEFWTNITNGVGAFFTWIADAFLNWTPIGFIIKNWEPITTFFNDWWTGTTEGIGNAVGWIGGKVDEFVGFFTDIPNKVGDAWTGLVKIASDVMLTITKFAVDAWNNTLGGLHVQLPWFLGGAEINLPRLKVPHLATGGIVTGPTLALIGEAGPEAVVPLSRGADRYGLGGSGGPQEVDVPIVLTLDGRELWRGLKRIKLREG